VAKQVSYNPQTEWSREKRCTQCGEVKPLEEFGFSQSGRTRVRRPRPSCKKCRVKYESGRYRLDPTPNKTRAAAWYQANRDRAITNALKSAKANPERVRKAKAKWSAANPEVNRATVQRRRARLRGGETEKFSDFEIFDRDGWICGICSQPIDADLKAPDPRSKSLDHVIPIAKGGDHLRSNVHAAHLSCNQSKSDRLDDEA
jgi:5-methylcytosine-specific restriction endonuclease McrA